MVDIGIKLKTLRLSKKLTQSQIASRIGISKAMISSYELSTRQPSYEVLIKLASLFRVSTDYLLGVERNRFIDVSGLTEENIAIIDSLVSAIKK